MSEETRLTITISFVGEEMTLDARGAKELDILRAIDGLFDGICEIRGCSKLDAIQGIHAMFLMYGEDKEDE